MAELIRHCREWMFYVELDDGEAPGQRKEFTETVFRPSGFYFTLYVHDTGVPHLRQATIAGPRILKSGEPGETAVSQKYYSVADLPDWAIRYYDQAVREVVSGTA